MSATWNGKPMASGRSSSILDAADAALARCSRIRSGCGLTPKQVRILMSQERMKVAKKETKPETPANPNPAPVAMQTEVMSACDRIDERNARIVAGWLAIPEGGRSLKKYSDAVRVTERTLRAVLEAKGVVIRDARRLRIAERLRRLQQMDCGGRSLAELASELGVSPPTVSALKQRADLQLNQSAGKCQDDAVDADRVPWNKRPRGQRSLDWALDEKAKTQKAKSGKTEAAS